MKEELLALEREALEALESIKEMKGLEQFRISYLGKKGRLTSIMKRLGELPPEERPVIGQLGNLVKAKIRTGFEESKAAIEAGESEEVRDLVVTTDAFRGIGERAVRPLAGEHPPHGSIGCLLRFAYEV